VALSAFIVPKEMVHQFYGHTDTVHTFHHSESDLPTVENEHEHCEMLNFNTPLYFFSVHFFSAGEKPTTIHLSENSKRFFCSPDFRLFSLRGPPAC
jgi:hypothetical protein